MIGQSPTDFEWRNRGFSMIELTQYQREWLRENGKARKLYSFSIGRMLLLSLSIAGFSWAAFFDGPALVGNISNFLIVLYVIGQFVGGLLGCFTLAATALMEIAFKAQNSPEIRDLERQLEELTREAKAGEEWQNEAGTDAHKPTKREKTKVNIDKIYKSLSKMPLPISWKYYAFVCPDVILDVTLFAVLVTAGWPFTACLAGSGSLFCWWVVKRLRRKLVVYIKNLTPPNEVNEEIDDLANHLFHDTDQL